MELSTTRQSGMGVGPISYAEIDAYLRLSGDELTIWEVRLIRRLDNAVRAVVGGQTSKAGKPTEQDAQIPVTNTSAIGSLMRGLKESKKRKG